jgi:hypothetical protein
MAELDQRIARINSARRLEQAEQSRRSRREKLAQRQQSDALQSSPAVRENRATQTPHEASAPGSPSSANRSIDPAAKSGNNLDAAMREARKARFVKKQQEAQERQRLRDQRLKEPVPAHLALPLPP